LEKIGKNDEKILRVNMWKERILMEKSEINNIKVFEKKENLKKITRKQEVEGEEIMQKIEEKSKRFEDFRMQKYMLAEKRKQIQSEISKKKARLFIKIRENLSEK